MYLVSTFSSLEHQKICGGKKKKHQRINIFNASTSSKLSAPDIDQAILHQRRYLLFGQRWSIIDTQDPFLGVFFLGGTWTGKVLLLLSFHFHPGKEKSQGKTWDPPQKKMWRTMGEIGPVSFFGCFVGFLFEKKMVDF